MEEATKNKISVRMKGNQNRKGKKQDFFVKIAIRDGNRGYHWYNDGKIEVKAKECPEGFTKGRLPKGVWVHDNEKEFLVKEVPEGVTKGRLWSTAGYHWYHDYKRNYLRKDYPTKEITNFQLVGKMKRRPKRIHNLPK